MPPQGNASPCFLADAMLGSLARKLRALGFDTRYYKEGGDAALLDLASQEGRIIITADRSLAARARAMEVRVILVGGSNDRARIREIVRTARLAGIPLRAGPSLCSICGGPLRAVPRAEAVRTVPPSVGRRHRLFERCTRCGQTYWHGSHWKKLMSLARILREN